MLMPGTTLQKRYHVLMWIGGGGMGEVCLAEDTRLHPANAEWLAAWDPQGVPILITPLDLEWGGESGACSKRSDRR